MKEQVLLYSVCAAISVAAVGITSIAKIVVCAIAKRAGKDLSGNVKEYIFTPIALILAALGLYIWLEKFMHVEDEELFVLIIERGARCGGCGAGRRRSGRGNGFAGKCKRRWGGGKAVRRDRKRND